MSRICCAFSRQPPEHAENDQQRLVVGVDFSIFSLSAAKKLFYLVIDAVKQTDLQIARIEDQMQANLKGFMYQHSAFRSRF